MADVSTRSSEQQSAGSRWAAVRRWRPTFRRNKEAKPKNDQPELVRRLRLLTSVFAVALFLLTGRLIDLQVLRADALSETALEFRSRSYTLHAQRGEILDTDGIVLARSVERYNIGVNQKAIQDYVHRDEDGEILGYGAAEAAKVLAPILDMDQADLGGLLLGQDSKSTYRVIARDVSPELWQEVNALRIPGIEPDQYMKREYPNGTVGGNILGFVGEDGEGNHGGQAGIERSYDSHLSGTSGSLTVEVSASGAVIPFGQREQVDSINGSDVVLTIDTDLQAFVDENLAYNVARSGAEWGAAVVIEIGTGRVLALSDTGTFNPANPGGSNFGSRAVQAPVEPGSTGKLMTFASAFDQGTVTPLTTFPVSSTITMPNGETIKDNDEHPSDIMTVAGILGVSYNTGLIQIGDTMTPETRYDYMVKFGLGEKTGIELPAESSGVLRPPDQWGPRERYLTMFGQSYSLTTVQLGQIAATIGNDGKRVQLHLVEGVVNEDGELIPTIVDDPVQVISPEAAQETLNIMQGVTDDRSTGQLARVDGYNVAGKTGTAQMPDENGRLTHRVGTFTGVVPAENPQIAIAIVVYNGAGAGYGSMTAAPVFGDVAEFAVRQRGIPPSQERLVQYPWYQSELNSAKSGDLIDENGMYKELTQWAP